MGVNRVEIGTETIIDITDSTVTADAMQDGIVAYGADGEKITGILPVWKNIHWTNSTLVWNDENKQVVAKGTMDLKRILDKDAPVEFRQDSSKYGDASPEDVVKGKTFTSVSGLKIEGTKEEKSFPALTNPGTANDLAEGMELIDADGNIVTGTLKEGKPGITGPKAQYNKSNIGTSTVNLISCVGTVSEDVICRAGQEISIGTSASDFGNATAGDVAEGKTFTSVNGLKIIGTKKETSGGGTGNNNCEAYLVDVTNPVVDFKTTGTIKAYGYAYQESTSSWMSSNTMYAFNGNQYYKSVSYGTPTATALTLSVSNGKLTGLPELSGGTLLVIVGV